MSRELRGQLFEREHCLAGGHQGVITDAGSMPEQGSGCSISFSHGPYSSFAGIPGASLQCPASPAVNPSG